MDRYYIVYGPLSKYYLVLCRNTYVLFLPTGLIFFLYSFTHGLSMLTIIGIDLIKEKQTWDQQL